MAWTDEMVEELKRLWEEGVTTGEIGRRLNISKNSIVGKVHRLGLSGRPSPIKKKDDEESVDSKSKPEAKTKQAPKKSVAKDTKKQAPKAAVAKPVVAAEPVAKPKVEEVKPLSEKKQEKKQEKKPDTKPVAKTVAEPNTDEEDIKLAKTLTQISSSTSTKGVVSLTDLDNHTCRWPVGDPKDPNFHFCGKKVRIGQTYCEEHAAVAYVKPGKR